MHPPRALEGTLRASREIRGQGCSRFIWFSFRPREGPAEEAPARQFHSVVKRQPGLCSPGWPVGLASSWAGESVVKEWSLIFWELSVSASECGPPPSFSIVSSEIIDKDALGGGG